MSEVVFVLGAGASAHAGAPLMKDFLAKANDLRRGPDAKQFKPDFDPVFDAIADLQAVHAKAWLDLDNVESVYAAFDMARLIRKLLDRSPEEIKALLVSMKRLIFKTLESTVRFPVTGRGILPTDAYASFATLVHDLSRSNSGHGGRTCSVITFNYDLALDYAFHTLHHGIDYCFRREQATVGTPLLKLHGSLNWVRCDECKKFQIWDFKRFIDWRFPLPFSLRDDEFVNLNIASRLPQADFQCCGNKVEPVPVIVPPTWNKGEHQQGLSGVWSRAANELSDARYIYVCGYSLTVTDHFFRYLFALGTVGKERIERFCVFDPDEQGDVLPRFEGLIGADAKRRFDFRKLKFAEAVETIRSFYPQG